MLTPSIWCIITQRYYFLGTTFIIMNRKCYLGKKQRSAWPKVWPHDKLIWSLILGGMPDQRSAWLTDLGKMSIWPIAWSWGGHLTKGQCDLKIRQKCQPGLKPDLGGTSDQRPAWPEDLTKISTWPKASSMGVHLSKCKKWQFEHTLHFRSCITEVFSMKDQLDTISFIIEFWLLFL